jgi:serine/threonine protein phosphatase PrpC
MAEETHTTRWRVVGHSVRGATHERTGMPNQDAIHWLPESSVGLPLILALADGHGSKRSFRSETGARFAVETATQIISDFLRGQAETESLSMTKRAAEEWLPAALVRAWMGAVASHLSVHPLSTDESKMLEGNRLGALAVGATSNSQLAYGTTLLAAAVAARFILYLQLGDGEILTVSTEGEVSKPLMKDERLFANETTSLCSYDAWRDFRVSFQVVSNKPPALILLSTDGYPNSFRDEEGFLKVGSDILEAIRDGGLEKVNAQLEAWLTESTYAGSGDDVTLGLICAEEVVESSSAQKSQRLAGQETERDRSGVW